MSDLQRIGIAIEAELLQRFDQLIARRKYSNRSEAFRDLARAELTRESAEAPDAYVVGSLTIVYDHHVRQLSEKLTEMQHEFHQCVLSSLHVHLDHHNCLEVIILRGRCKDIRALADALISVKGVKNGSLTIGEAQVQTVDAPPQRPPKRAPK